MKWVFFRKAHENSYTGMGTKPDKIAYLVAGVALLLTKGGTITFDTI